MLIDNKLNIKQKYYNFSNINLQLIFYYQKLNVILINYQYIQQLGEEAPYRFSFDWHCKEGIQKNIAKIREEFNIYNDLKPNKIFLTGPPASGKTYYSKQLQQFYNVPYICVKDVVDEVLALNNEFSEEIKAALEEVRGSMAEQEQEKMDKLKEKREKQGLPINDADYEVIPEKLNPRIPDNLLYKAFKWRLMKNDCQNRGFILDGYGRNYQDAKGLFLKNKPQENEDEPVDEENPVLVRDENICPDHVILLQASNEQLTERIKNLSEEQLSESTHFDEQGLNRRLKLYRDQNENEDGRPSLLQFLQQQNIDVLSVSVSNNNLFDTIKSFVQRNGKYKNFMTFEDEQERQRVENTQKIQQQKKLDYENYNREMDRKEQEQRELVEEIYKLEQEDQRKKDSETLEQQSLPLRQYLQKNLVPFLSDGLLYVIKNKHEDPVDFLAEYLFKRSLEVPYTDPLKFKLSNNSV